ncbi:MAG TPA: hypothetical protein VGI32_10230 [Steroidobacteraceae bacterium]|jgi:hypothetical protein
MRPKSIVYFEWIIFGTVLLGVLQSCLSWDRTIAHVATTPPDRNLAVGVLTALIFDVVLIGTLTLLVSRRRSKIAMWVSVAMFVLGLPVFVQSITRGLLESHIIAALVCIGQAVAYGVLFTPSSRCWMSREGQAA